MAEDEGRMTLGEKNILLAKASYVAKHKGFENYIPLFSRLLPPSLLLSLFPPVSLFSL